MENVDAQSLHEYQKLVATGLGCLEVVLDSPKLAPRLEAQVRFRYASILCEETNNVMEAETALTKGITLCERVIPHPITPHVFSYMLISNLESVRRFEICYAFPPNQTSFCATKSKGSHDRCRWSDTGR